MEIRKHIPNMVTSMNLVCGIIGVIFAFNGRIDLAFPMMLMAAVFDFLDGFVARALNAYSDMGKELDSLCDLVSFGVLPSVMLYNLMTQCLFVTEWYCYIPLVITLFSALRLAKFNVDERQHESFLGLATPACAMICGALSYYIAYTPSSVLATWAAGPFFIPVLSVLLSALLVCEIPMFSLKGKLRGPLGMKLVTLIILVAIVIVLMVFRHMNWSFAVLSAFVLYILSNIVYVIAKV